jgi:uncharacterized membrane protein YcfT
MIWIRICKTARLMIWMIKPRAKVACTSRSNLILFLIFLFMIPIVACNGQKNVEWHACVGGRRKEDEF